MAPYSYKKKHDNCSKNNELQNIEPKKLASNYLAFLYVLCSSYERQFSCFFFLDVSKFLKILLFFFSPLNACVEIFWKKCRLDTI